MTVSFQEIDSVFSLHVALLILTLYTFSTHEPRGAEKIEVISIENRIYQHSQEL